MQAKIEKLRFRYGRGAIRVAGLVTFFLVLVCGLLTWFCFFSADKYADDSIGTYLFSSIAICSLVCIVYIWRYVFSNFSGWLVVQDTGISLVRGNIKQETTWSQIDAVAHNHRLKIRCVLPSSSVTSVSMNSASEAALLEERYDRITEKSLASVSVDEWTIVISLTPDENNQEPAPLIISGTMLSNYKKVFEEIFEVIYIKLQDRKIV